LRRQAPIPWGIIIELLSSPSSLFLPDIIFLFCSSLVPIKPGAGEPKRVNLTKGEKEAFSLSLELTDIIVGLVLGDMNVQKDKRAVNGNARLRFVQGTVHKEYLLEVYELLKDYCSGGPKITTHLPDKKTGVVHSSIRFSTYSLPCFNFLHDLFYPDGIKIIPQNIAELIKPIGLAFWLMDDGYWNQVGRYVVLCTESFTPAEVRLLINALNSKWDLKCYENKRGDSYRIVIPAYSIPLLRTLVEPHMVPAMRYKIGL